MPKAKLKIFSFLSLSFILFTIIGTLSHEAGHIAVAKYYGYKTTLHFGSMSWEQPWAKYAESLKTIYEKYPNRKTAHGLIGTDSAQAAILRSKIGKAYTPSISRAISTGGPAQTLLTSIVGILLLVYRNKLIQQNGLQLFDWLAVFLALFSLRFVANMTLSVLSELWAPNGSYFGGDEARLARGLNLHQGTFAIPLFCIGILVAVWVIFSVIGPKLRFTFIVSGLIGGSFGYWFWLYWLGPILLP